MWYNYKVNQQTIWKGELANVLYKPKQIIMLPLSSCGTKVSEKLESSSLWTVANNNGPYPPLQVISQICCMSVICC